MRSSDVQRGGGIRAAHFTSLSGPPLPAGRRCHGRRIPLGRRVADGDERGGGIGHVGEVAGWIDGAQAHHSLARRDLADHGGDHGARRLPRTKSVERSQRDHRHPEAQVVRPGELVGAALRRPAGVSARAAHPPTQLAGGGQRRIALARAFINKPKVRFADEPTGNLDAETSQRVIDIMLELNRADGTALVLVTHDPDVARLTERTIRLRSGEMVA